MNDVEILKMLKKEPKVVDLTDMKEWAKQGGWKPEEVDMKALNEAFPKL